MSERLLIRLHSDGQLTWLAQDANGRALSGSNAGAPPAATVARARRIVALVPSERVLMLETAVVSPRRAQFAKALPFALEDQLAAPVEDLHFALPARIAGDRVAVAVVARAALQEWIAALAGNGIRADAMYPESLVLAGDGERTTLMIEPARSVLRSGALAFACETSALTQWLALAPAAPLEVHDFRQAPRLALAASVAAYRERQPDALAFLAGRLAHEPDLNLLQGEFAPSHRHVPVLQLWRRAALIVAAAVMLAFAHAGADYLRLNREAQRIEGAQRELLRVNLPELAGVAGDPRNLMQSALTRMRGDGSGSGLLRILGQVGPTLAATTRVQLKGLEYRNATLELALRAPDVPALDLVREQLANLGLRVDVTEANASDKGIEGRLRVSGGKP
jgi:general secretion pathway protein L